MDYQWKLILDRIWDCPEQTLNELYLDGFSGCLAADGKAVRSFATKPAKKSGKRREHEADWCRKTYTTTTDKGEKNMVTKQWLFFSENAI